MVIGIFVTALSHLVVLMGLTGCTCVQVVYVGQYLCHVDTRALSKTVCCKSLAGLAAGNSTPS